MKNNKVSGIISLLVVVAVMFGIVFAVKAITAEPAPAVSSEGETAEAPKTVSGTFTGKGVGFDNGEITATVTITDDKITDVVVTGENQTPAIGGKALEELPAKIVEAGSTDIDAFSGATLTSNGIFEAVNDALAQSKQ